MIFKSNYQDDKNFRIKNLATIVEVPQTNPLMHNPGFRRDNKILKTIWKKEKTLETSIFSLSHNVFYPVIKEVKKKTDMF